MKCGLFENVTVFPNVSLLQDINARGGKQMDLTIYTQLVYCRNKHKFSLGRSNNC